MEHESLDQQLERVAINADAAREARESNKIIKDLEQGLRAACRWLYSDTYKVYIEPAHINLERLKRANNLDDSFTTDVCAIRRALGKAV